MNRHIETRSASVSSSFTGPALEKKEEFECQVESEGASSTSYLGELTGRDPPKDSRLTNKERKEGGHKTSKCRVVDWHPRASKSTGANAALDYRHMEQRSFSISSS
jgi:hypothetical protein